MGFNFSQIEIDNLIIIFEARFHRSYKPFLQVTVEVAEGVVDLAVLAWEGKAAILRIISHRITGEEIPIAPVVFDTGWEEAFGEFRKIIFSSEQKSLDSRLSATQIGGPATHSGGRWNDRISYQSKKPLSVVLDSKNPIVKTLLNAGILRALLSTDLKLRVSSSDAEIRALAERAFQQFTNPIERAQVARGFRFSPQSFEIFASQEAQNGAGALIQPQFELVDKSIAITIADTNGVKHQDFEKLVLPILLIAAKLGSFASGRKLTDSEVAVLKRQLSDFGVELSLKNGQLVGTILMNKLIQWFNEYEGQKLILKAA